MALGGVGYFATGYFHLGYWHDDWWSELSGAVTSAVFMTPFTRLWYPL